VSNVQVPRGAGRSRLELAISSLLRDEDARVCAPLWHWGRGIGEKWDGFIAEPDEFVMPVAEHNSVEKEEEEEEDSEDDEECDEEDEDSEEQHTFEESGEFDFPSCTVRDAKRVYRHIRQHCRDYRSVCYNNGYDGGTPVFFVGESKAAPHRWTGYTGEKTWT
jgi:hypothetical protein